MFNTVKLLRHKYNIHSLSHKKLSFHFQELWPYFTEVKHVSC